MTAKNKQRGNALEYEVVKAAQTAGFKAQRAYASDGRALGCHTTVDVLINDSLRVQCKRRKQLPNWLCVEELLADKPNFDVVVVRQDRAKPLAVLPLDQYFALIKANGPQGREIV